mmetsp:Transcript_20108/g.80205  ORF Transcript_20108/g.80205 Transcript_20108/m.80205 type:complete len:311 (-) Transcript_20108:1345-2277(-)
MMCASCSRRRWRSTARPPRATRPRSPSPTRPTASPRSTANSSARTTATATPSTSARSDCEAALVTQCMSICIRDTARQAGRRVAARRVRRRERLGRRGVPGRAQAGALQVQRRADDLAAAHLRRRPRARARRLPRHRRRPAHAPRLQHGRLRRDPRRARRSHRPRLPLLDPLHPRGRHPPRLLARAPQRHLRAPRLGLAPALRRRRNHPRHALRHRLRHAQRRRRRTGLQPHRVTPHSNPGTPYFLSSLWLDRLRPHVVFCCARRLNHGFCSLWSTKKKKKTRGCCISLKLHWFKCVVFVCRCGRSKKGT